MPGRALSERAKRARDRAANDLRMADAIETYRNEQCKPKNERRPLRNIATDFKVSKTTLSRLFNGGRSITEFNRLKCKLSPEEEQVLLELAEKVADGGLPLSHEGLRAAALKIQEDRLGEGKGDLGKNWVDHFLIRYNTRLSTHWSKPLDSARARALNPDVVRHWFELVKETLMPEDSEEILLENIYNMDESGFPPQDTLRRRVIGRRGARIQHRVATANRENVTVIVTICADGEVLKPTVIFKGKNFMRAWTKNNPTEASVCHSPNGWTDSELAFKWFVDDFDALTREKAQGRTRVLLADGHISHYTARLLQYGLDHNIVILGSPPHTTHALQALDVVCFAKLKDIWCDEIRQFEAIHHRGVRKADFLGVFGTAFTKCFSDKELVKTAFRRTGVWPYDPTVIKPSQMAPSYATSTKGMFPLPQSSPVRAIVAWMRTPASPPPSPSLSNAPIPPAPVTSTPAPEPSAPEPSASAPPEPTTAGATTVESIAAPSWADRAAGLRQALGTTQSGPILLGTTRATSTDVPPPIVLELPRNYSQPITLLGGDGFDASDPSVTRKDLITRIAALSAREKALVNEREEYRHVISRCHAQLSVQATYCQQLAASLNEKETSSVSNRSKIFTGGKGRHLTHFGVIAEIRQHEDAQVAKQAAKTRKKKVKAIEAAAKLALEAEWTKIQAAHQKKKVDWIKKCQRLRKGGERLKDLPPGPGRIQAKPKLAEFMETWAGIAEGEEIELPESEGSDDEDDL